MAGKPTVTYSGMIVEALTRYRSREAFVFGERRMTYAEAAQATARYVTAFERRGVGLGSGVAMLGPNSPESWLVQAATYLRAAHFSGLQLLGSIEDHVFVCDDAEVSLLVVAEACADQGAEIMAKSATVKDIIVIPSRGELVGDDSAQVSGDLTFAPVGDEDVAWLQYTGGTTGRPKGVMLSQGAMVQQTLSLMASWGLPEEPRYLAASPITHAAVLPVLATLLRGGTVVLLPSFDPEGWLRAVHEHRVNYAFAVPTMIYALLDMKIPAGYDLSCLETLAYGAAPMSPARLIEAQEKFGHVFLQVYGQTENAGSATSLRRDEHAADRPHLMASCGRAVVGAQVTVLDDDGNEVPTGEVGELCVRTRAAMLGYRNLPDETEAVLRDGWLRSGDLARQDDEGFFFIVDRKKDMIISGGFNIYAREVEDILTTHPAVSAAAVIGVPDDKWGEAVSAIVVTGDGQSLDPAELIAFVRERKGPMYAPKTVQFVNRLPTTTVGKIDKNALRAPYWSEQPRKVH